MRMALSKTLQNKSKDTQLSTFVPSNMVTSSHSPQHRKNLAADTRACLMDKPSRFPVLCFFNIHEAQGCPPNPLDLDTCGISPLRFTIYSHTSPTPLLFDCSHSQGQGTLSLPQSCGTPTTWANPTCPACSGARIPSHSLPPLESRAF